jgi:hypothetical protein
MPNEPQVESVEPTHSTTLFLYPQKKRQNGAPWLNTSKWLVVELKLIPPLDWLEMKNFINYKEKVQDLTTVLVLFDVVLLIPSIPIDLALSQKKMMTIFAFLVTD